MEPWAEIYDIPAGASVSVACSLVEGKIDFEVDYGKDNFLGLWVPSGTTLMIDGVPVPRVLSE